VEQDKTKKPVTDMVFSEAEEVMHLMAQVYLIDSVQDGTQADCVNR
jgi:hypothetical protein